MPVLPALQRYFPQAIETGTRFMSLPSAITLGTQRFEETVMRVDSGFPAMFNLETLAGNLADALSAPGKMALRAAVAQRYFGGSENIDRKSVVKGKRG